MSKWRAVISVAGWATMAATGNASEIYRCESNGQVQYRDDARGLNCRMVTQLAPGKVSASQVTSVESDEHPSANVGEHEHQRQRQRQLQEKQLELQVLRKQYQDGQPERRGDERNYAKYLARKQAMEQAIARTEEELAQLQRQQQ